VGFALVWAITALAIAGSAVIARNAEEVLERTLGSYADDLMHASRAQLASERMVAVGRGYLLTRDPERLARAREAEVELVDALRSLERSDLTPGDRQLLREVQSSAGEYQRLLDHALEVTSRGEGPDAVLAALQEGLIPARERLDARLEQLVTHKQQLQTAARRNAKAAAARSVHVTLGLGLLALFLSAFLAGTFTSSLSEASRREKEHARRAERALAARDELLRIVAHDLRNPLAAISLRASAIARAGDVRSGAREEVGKVAGGIVNACHRMAHLLESLLDAAGIEAGHLMIRPQRLAVGSLLHEAIETFEPVAQEKGIRIAAGVVPSDLSVCADRERLLQVLSNLVGNALKFTPARGAVTVTAMGGDSEVSFKVSDTGAGIPRDDVAHVFDRYWTTNAPRAKGVGLGLYIAKGLVEAHGGRIWVESAVGQGSCFGFDLPVAPAHPPSTRPG
jgi:signal transduction histidine kinase